MLPRKVTHPDFSARAKFSIAQPYPWPRAQHAEGWGLLFLLGLLPIRSLLNDPSWIDGGWVILAWAVGSIACYLLASRAEEKAGKVWKPRWLKHASVASTVLILLLLFSRETWRSFSDRPSREAREAFVAEQSRRDAVDHYTFGWDAQAWSALVQDMPPGAPRDACVDDFSRSLSWDLREHAMVPSDALAAAADAGALRGEAAGALLTSPRRRLEHPFDDAATEARVWLRDGTRHDLSDDIEYARAVAVHDVLPESPELREIVAAALETDSGPLLGQRALARLAHLVRIADLVGVSTDVPELRARVLATLHVAHRDEGSSWGEPSIGFVHDTADPDDRTNAQATHAALELMDRFGVPDDVDLSHQRAGCILSARSAWQLADRLVSEADAARLQARWPAESAPRPGSLDAAFVLALVLLGFALRDIRRQPLIRSAPSKEAAASAGAQA